MFSLLYFFKYYIYTQTDMTVNNTGCESQHKALPYIQNEQGCYNSIDSITECFYSFLTQRLIEVKTKGF